MSETNEQTLSDAEEIEIIASVLSRRLGMGKRRNKPHGITNRQAGYLARLQRQAGEPYTGRGMTTDQAAAEIERLAMERAALRKLKKATARRRREAAKARTRCT
jgi:hypothetical protein